MKASSDEKKIARSDQIDVQAAGFMYVRENMENVFKMLLDLLSNVFKLANDNMEKIVQTNDNSIAQKSWQ